MTSQTKSRQDNDLPKIALVGRTNVGKSTLFNRLAGKHKALTSDIAGTTRDFYETIVSWQDKSFYLLDTGGMNTNNVDEIENQISIKTQQAIKEADILLMVVDGKEGLQPLDREVYSQLKKLGKTIVLAINKSDNAKRWDALKLEFSELGFEDSFPVSAINGIGSGDLLDQLTSMIDKKKYLPTATKIDSISLAIIGKPNVGKSSLSNAILHHDKQITSSQPHTTRDAQEIDFRYQNQNFTLIDTAGIRRRTKKSDLLEKFSVDQSLEKLKYAKIALFVIDISEPLSFQDKHLSSEIIANKNSLIIIANKWDLIEDKNESTINTYTKYIRKFFPYMSWAPIIFTSATNQQRTDNILDLSLTIYQERFRQITDNALDKFLKKMIKKHPPARGKGVAHPYIYHLNQVDTDPPTFEVMIKYKKSLHASYLRFLEKQLREEFSFTGTPLRLYIKSVK